VPACTWIEEISLRHPVCDSAAGCLRGAERPGELGCEKIVIWQAPLCANAGGGGRSTGPVRRRTDLSTVLHALRLGAGRLEIDHAPVQLQRPA